MRAAARLQSDVRNRAGGEALFFPAKSVLRSPECAACWSDLQVQALSIINTEGFALRIGVFDGDVVESHMGAFSGVELKAPRCRGIGWGWI